MILNYDILTQIGIKHHYFGAVSLSSTVWVPSNETRILGKKLGLIFKSVNGVLNIYASCETVGSKKILDYKLQDRFALTFFIQLNQQYWSNFTPVKAEKGSALYFSNEEIRKDGENYFLQKKNDVSEDDTIKLVSSISTLLFDGQNVETSELAKKDGTQESYDYGIKLVNNSLSINSRLLDEGEYELKSNEGKVENFFLLKDASSYDGICHLVFSPDWGGENKLINEDWSWNKMDFELSFPSRETFWRYYFSKKGLSLFEGVEVLDENGEDVFNSGNDVIIHSGEEMVCFTSKEPIKLKQKMDVHFQLKKNVGVENRSEGVIINKLPTPEKETLFRVDEKGIRYSDIYINF